MNIWNTSSSKLIIDMRTPTVKTWEEDKPEIVERLDNTNSENVHEIVHVGAGGTRKPALIPCV